VAGLQAEIEEEKKRSNEVREQMQELVQIREHLKEEVSAMRLKTDSQSRTIYDQHTSDCHQRQRKQKS
jgi:predicted  nucleic acid-binding Zn-ribbon protein